MALPTIWWLYNWFRHRDPERATRRVETHAKELGAGVEELRADIKELKHMLRERSASTAGQQEAQPGPSLGDQIGSNLEAGIETLLEAGREAALRDKTGKAAEAALDELIAGRQAARHRIARDEAALWRQKGAFAFLHDTGAAIVAYAKAAELDPDDAKGWYWLGQLQQRAGNLAAAKTSFQRLLALRNSIADPQLVHWTHMLIGDVERDQGDLAAALDQYRRASSAITTLAKRDPANAGMAARSLRLA